jgi:tripartite-type tricarboxylate transporter receptor subunit TctC
MKKKTLFTILCLVLVATMVLASGCSGQTTSNAQQNQASEEKKIDFPTKPIRLIMPYAAGGGSDVLARKLAENVSKYLPNNQTVVVENKAGGAGVIGTTELIGSKADGYTIEEAVNGVLTFQPHFGKATYTYSDVKPIAGLTAVPNIMVVRADAPWNTLDEWLAYVKANPGKFTYGTVGKGTFAHVAAEGVNKAAGLEMTVVQFDGGAPAITALMGGHVDGAALLATDAKSYVDSGDVKVIYTTVETTMYPGAETPKSKGIDFETVAWTGLFAPKDTPDEIVQIISEAYKKTLEDPEVIKSFETMGYTPKYADAATYAKIIEDEFKSNETVLKSIGLIK